MERLLVAGIDSVVGANLAAHLADQYEVVEISAARSVSIEGCETAVVSPDVSHRIREAVACHRPDRIVVCTAAGDSPWHRAGAQIADAGAIAAARAWSKAAQDRGAALTLISSDAIFTGPWLFHAETSTALCESAKAQSLRTLEASTLDECPAGLIVRTHGYGWSPFLDGSGWIEGILASLESDRPGLFDCVPHATPILATDLADVLSRAWAAGLSGIYHIAGAERANPLRFACALAEIFELTPPRAAVLAPADGAQTGFAQGETSLATRSIRSALGAAMPLLADGLKRLCDQREDGYDRRLRSSRRPASKVA